MANPFYPEQNVTIRREHGIFQYPLAAGGHVTAISQPGWEHFAGALTNLNDPGQYVVSPELITTSPIPEDLSRIGGIIAERSDQVREVSRRWPETTFILGTLSVGQTALPRNGTTFYRAGAEVGRNPKMPYIPGEAAIFHAAYDPAEHRQPDTETVAMVCSDLSFHSGRGKQYVWEDRDVRTEYVDPISPDVRTIFISSMWIVPAIQTGLQNMHSDMERRRFVSPVRVNILRLMQQHPGVQDVIMVDQLPPGSPGFGPINVHARRIQ